MRHLVPCVCGGSKVLELRVHVVFLVLVAAAVRAQQRSWIHLLGGAGMALSFGCSLVLVLSRLHTSRVTFRAVGAQMWCDSAASPALQSPPPGV